MTHCTVDAVLNPFPESNLPDEKCSAMCLEVVVIPLHFWPYYTLDTIDTINDLYDLVVILT